MASARTWGPEIPHHTRSALFPHPWPSPTLRFPPPFWLHLGALPHVCGTEARGGVCSGDEDEADQMLGTVDGCSKEEKTKSPAVCVVPECVRARL